MKTINPNLIEQFVIKHLSVDVSDNIAELRSIVESISDLVESLAIAKVKITEGESWMYHSQTLVNKIIFNTYSILSLSEGYIIQSGTNKEINISVRDFSSVLILTRALMENYLTLCYIYHNDESEEEKIFRYKLWQISGLISRQNFDDSSDEIVTKKK